MAVADNLITQALAVESGRLGADLYQDTLYDSPWLALPKRGVYLDEMGQIQSVVTYDRFIAATEEAWTNVGQSAGTDGGSCLPPVDEITAAYTTRTYQLQHKAIQSELFCVNDLRIAWKRKDQMAATYMGLKENAKIQTIKRRRSEYQRLAEHKITLYDNSTMNPPESTSAFPTANAPDSYLTAAFMGTIYNRLVRDGGNTGAVSVQNGRPIFTVITSPETQRALIRENSAIREDFRQSSERDHLLKAMGVTHTYDGFTYQVDMTAPRYTFASGAFTEVPFYDTEAATSGTRAVVNPDYADAPYEVTYVFLDNVYEVLLPAPITSVGPATFNPVNYMGNFKLMNIIDKDTNPDGTMVYFRGILSDASKPITPRLGYAIMHLRCDPTGLYAACPT